MEQILNWNPDVILFAPGSIYDTVAGNENWQTISAIQSGNTMRSPWAPITGCGIPAQRPAPAGYDVDGQGPVSRGRRIMISSTEVSTYFELFYHCDLTQAQYDALVANSIPAASAADQAA